MEEFRYTYNTATAIPKRAHTGVVGSGDAEILMEPSHIGEVFIKTNVEGFQKTWEEVVQRFMSAYDVRASIHIHDFGATPGVIGLRLKQAFEEASS